MMREKHRYVLVETTSEIVDDEQTVMRNLAKEILRCIGEANYHRVNPKLTKITSKNSFIMKSTLVGINQLILSFALIKRMDNKDIAFYTLKTSGTIKALLK